MITDEQVLVLVVVFFISMLASFWGVGKFSNWFHNRRHK